MIKLKFIIIDIIQLGYSTIDVVTMKTSYLKYWQVLLA